MKLINKYFNCIYAYIHTNHNCIVIAANKHVLNNFSYHKREINHRFTIIQEKSSAQASLMLFPSERIPINSFIYVSEQRAILVYKIERNLLGRYAKTNGEHRWHQA